MADTAIAAVLSKVGELAASEAKILLEVGDNMMLLRDRLEWLQAFIRDADRRRRIGTDDQLTRVWVRQTRDVSFQAEDALDEFAYQVDMKSQGYRGWKKMWRKYLIGFYAQIVSRHTLSARITRINMRLAKIAENQKEYNISHTPLAPVTSSTTATSAWTDAAVGFDDDVTTIRRLLLRKDHQRQMFISILGESGVGKMTLVNMIIQKVANTSSMFEVTLWVGVAADSTVDYLLGSIYKWGLEVLNQPKEEGINDITEKVRRLLAGKRYLVIISGIPSKTMLSCVRASLPDDNNGSRVLLVLDTANEEVAWHANSMNQEGFNGIHMLNRLDEKRSGQLFRSRAFRREVCDGSNMSFFFLMKYGLNLLERKEMMYDKIVYDITGGYPLAIVVLAGLLRFKERPGQWEAVLQQLKPGPRMEEALVQGGDSEGNKQMTEEVVLSTSHSNLLSTRTTAIERVFWASFEDLPNDLKSCFLYFVAYPRKAICTASGIVRMWIAEGFIKPQKGKTVEELGHNYLKELVLRCLLRIDATNDAGDGIKDVSVHPRLHGFLQSEAREAGFMEVHDMHHVLVPPSVRRLSSIGFGSRYTSFTKKFPKLRSFICWVEEEQHHQSNDSKDTNNKKHGHDLKFLCGSKFLRVISIRGTSIEELPNNIGDMIHLRYLRVQCRYLKELPSSIKRLLNLQTLDIEDTQVERIDPGFWLIRTLRHVLAEKLALPETIQEELGDLQTLSGVNPAQGGEWKQGQKCALHMMPNLRTLRLHGIAHDKHGAALQSALVEMRLLSELRLQGDVIPSCVFTAPSLRFLQMLELDGTGTVEWPVDGWDARKVRPNLVQVKVKLRNVVPPHIREEIEVQPF